MDDSLPKYFRYWGKADLKYEREPKWHPVVYHSLDVAACARTLLSMHSDWLSKLSACSNLSEKTLFKWIPFLLAVHDPGKFGNGFQNQRPDLQELLHGRSTSASNSTRHDTMGYELLMQFLPTWLGREDLNNRGGLLIKPWIAAVAGHHGRPPRNDSSWALIQRDNFPNSVIEDIKQFIVDLAALLLPNGCPLPESGGDFSESYKSVSWLLAGVAVAADWLGSNTTLFPYHEPALNLLDYWQNVALPNTERAIKESGLVQAHSAPFNGIKSLFKNIKEPTPLQDWAQNVKLAGTPQLFIFEELTGSGKTEAALTLAARLLEQKLGNGIYVALPTMATADAMFDRVRKNGAYRRMFADEQISLALAHSADRLKFALEEANRRDSGYGKDEVESASQQCSAWLSDNRKKALLADFGIGTIDQALLVVLSAKHQSLRLLGLSTKVLIVDEVHACDAYMGELLERLLSFHAALGGSAILLSATLPQNQRGRLVDAFASGLCCPAMPPAKQDYPLATHWHADAGDEWENKIEARKEVSRSVKVDIIAEEEEVFKRLENSTENDGCAVWIRNTVVDAVDAWNTWNSKHPDQQAVLFHARFALIDRLRIGKQVENAFGPDSTFETRKSSLVIANQVIEQSLDVDFDDMVTDLVPIDLVIQRAGRLQRHIRDTAGNRLLIKGMKDRRGGAKLGIFMPEPILDAASNWYTKLLPKAGKVYPDHARLWLTAHWLAANKKGFELPRQARDMIESVYGGNGDVKIPSGLENSENKAIGDRSAERSLAALNALSFESGYQATGLHWNDDDNAPTRLGEATIRVRLARITDNGLIPWARTKTGMEWALSELTIPKRLIAGENPRHAVLIERARVSMRDEGRYSVVVPLIENNSGYWYGFAANIDGDEIMVKYSEVTGLSIEKGVDDESDL
jgi:CRISPR-associated endonuclease/helicase Cas3